jgi:hypothetical protein
MKPRVLLGAFALALGMSFALCPVLEARRPNVFRRHRIQQMINRGNGFAEAARQERQEEGKWRRAWQQSGDPTALDDYEAHHNARLAWEESLRANRNTVIDSVDSAYDCGVPPGTEVKYDPNCGGRSPGTSGGYCSPKCYIRICEPAFDDPALVAAVKMHEGTHAKQKAAGRWGPDNVPFFCTRLRHELEAEAYNAMLEAHSKGDILLPPWWHRPLEKLKKYHAFAHDREMISEFLWRRLFMALPGDTLLQCTTIINDSDEPADIYGSFSNRLAWAIEPPAFGFFLESEQETTFEIAVAVPPDAEVGIGNEVVCHAYRDTGGVPADSSMDFFFIDVTTTVDTRPGPNVEGSAGNPVEFYFTVANLAEKPDSIEVSLTSLMGWPLSQYAWVLTLDASDSTHAMSSVTLPDDDPFATDMILCHAVSLGIPGQRDSSELFAMVKAATAGVGPDRGRPVFALLPNSPNPFMRSTLVRFSLPKRSAVALRVYDVRGRLVRTLVGPDRALEPGIHAIQWDGTDAGGRRVASGVYFTELKAVGRVATRKVVLLR